MFFFSWCHVKLKQPWSAEYGLILANKPPTIGICTQHIALLFFLMIGVPKLNTFIGKIEGLRFLVMMLSYHRKFQVPIAVMYYIHIYICSTQHIAYMAIAILSYALNIVCCHIYVRLVYILYISYIYT